MRKKVAIPLGKPYHSDCEIERIRNVLDSGCWAGTCPEVHRFEDEFAKIVGVKHAIATSSCMTALHTALLAVGITIGDEVICPAFTHPATRFAIEQCIAWPAIVDVSRDTYTIAPRLIEQAITEDTAAICPVYAFGLPPDKEAIDAIATEHRLHVIWDTATGLGAQYGDSKAGSFNDVECFSFFPTKNISTGEGGMITTNNDEIAEHARALVDFGMKKHSGKFTMLGYNYRLSAIQAAIGRCQLEMLPKFVEAKRRLVTYYIKRINEEKILWLSPQSSLYNATSAAQRFVCTVQHTEGAALRDGLMKHLKTNGIGCAIGANNVAEDPFFASGSVFPNAQYLFLNSVALPLFYGMGESDVDVVIAELKAFGVDV